MLFNAKDENTFTWFKHFICVSGHGSHNDHTICVHNKQNTTLISFYKTIYFIYRTGSQWYYVTPFAMRKMLNWISKHYPDVPIYITETGTSDNDGTINDKHRVNYIKEYSNEVLKGKQLLYQVEFWWTLEHLIMQFTFAVKFLPFILLSGWVSLWSS